LRSESFPSVAAICTLDFGRAKRVHRWLRLFMASRRII
jgi:hypothetical protein